jgi:hypothetical protein
VSASKVRQNFGVFQDKAGEHPRESRYHGRTRARAALTKEIKASGIERANGIQCAAAGAGFR